MTKVWGHDGCADYYRLPLTSCPRHPGSALREVTMPKITRAGGSTISGLTDTPTGQVQRVAGFSDDTAATTAKAEQLKVADAPVTVPAVDAPFDPAEWSVADVNAELAECTDEERAAVIAAERAGKNRRGITGG